MTQFRTRIAKFLIAIALIADLLALGAWAFQPPWIDRIWPGLVVGHEQSPVRRLGYWVEGAAAPWTVTGLLSLFYTEELVIAGALLTLLLILTTLLLRKWLERRWEADLQRAIRTPRIRVLTALVLVALIALILGWELESWKNWRRRQAYSKRWEVMMGEVARLGKTQRYLEAELPQIEAAIARKQTTGYHAHYSPAKPIDGRIAIYYRRYKVRKELAETAAILPLVSAMRLKYERATASPWRPVDPDPPWPQMGRDAVNLLANREYTTALAEFDELIRHDPLDVWALDCRAWVWATCPIATHRDGKRAVESATRVCELTDWDEGYALDTLAAAYAEVGDYDKAVASEEQALRKFDRMTPHLKSYHDRLALFKQRKPFRDRLR
jgi:tetratricopeptide (TPR) repeat protein